jgi:glucose-1-phosphate thymidylyltransferase
VELWGRAVEDLELKVGLPRPREVIGLIPAGGRAHRIAPLPCSKEIYPIGCGYSAEKQGLRPKVVGQYVLEKMRAAGITKVYFILRKGKWDIPGYFGDGAALDLHLGYLMMGVPFGVPYTLDQAYPFVREATVALGWPDILLDAEDAFARILERITDGDVDVVLGLFPTGRPQKVDMIDVSSDGRVRQIVIKPRHTTLHYTWGNAVWTPTFTEFLHQYVVTHKGTAANQSEVFVGDIMQAAIRAGLRVMGVPISSTPCLDMGTPEELLKAIRLYTPEHA